MIPIQYAASPTAAPPAILPARREPGSADEANHRIANNLQMLSALVSFEARRIADPDARAGFDAMIRRIGAIAGVHRQLYGAGGAAGVDLGDYLVDLGDHLDATVSAADGRRTIFVDPASVDVSAEQASAIGIIVSELVGNALKYAYGPDRPGPVRIVLRALPMGGYWLEVADRGRGLVAGAGAQGTGLGTRLVTAMADRLGATFAWHDNRPGTRFTLCTGRA